jgi:hypothetical protein
MAAKDGLGAVQIAAAMGGTGTFRPAVRDARDLHARILDGIPYRAFEFLVESFGFARPDVLEVLRVPRGRWPGGNTTSGFPPRSPTA